MDIVNEFHKSQVINRVVSEAFLDYRGGSWIPIHRAVCNDGFYVSIQASAYHHCMPRNHNEWPYESFELGYPSELDPLIEDYAEAPGTADTVFNYVPVDVVVELINKHGGFKMD